jgi:glutamyl-tRNA synthetase
VHNLSYDAVKDRSVMDGVDEKFWQNVQANLTKVGDVRDWIHITNEKISVSVSAEDKAYIKQALDLLPEGEIDETTWVGWTGTLKEQSGRKGKELFMPLRQALTGMDHGPEMDKVIQLLGRDRIIRRLERAST